MTRTDRVLLLATATPVFTVTGALVLWWLNRLTDPWSIVITLGLVALADMGLTWVVERRSPTRVLLRHGHRGHVHAEVISGFDNHSPGKGRVRAHNEIWDARSENDAAIINAGTRVVVIERDGLVLTVRTD